MNTKPLTPNKAIGSLPNGKKIQRPGGKELTLKLVEALKITSEDNIVELCGS